MPAIGQLALQLGQQAAAGAVGGGMGIAFGKSADRRAYQLHEKIVKRNEESSKELANYNFMKELEMWEKTNYSAQVEQLKKAGLNPGLLYGMGGGGGTTIGSPGPGAATGGGGRSSEEAAVAQTVMQLGLQRAQKENIEADTELKQQQAGAAGASIPKTEAETRLIEIEQEIKNLELSYGKETFEQRIHQLNILVDQSVEQLQILRAQKTVDIAQVNNKIEMLSKQVAGQILENGLKEQKITESKEQIEKWKAEIAQAWTHLDIQQYEADIKSFEASLKAKYPGLWNVIGRILNDTGRKIGELIREKYEPQEIKKQ